MAKVIPDIDAFPIKGRVVDLKLVEVEDASYIHALRTDPDLSKHLSPIDATVTEQARWIERYKVRENAGDEFYFVVLSKAQSPCGLVRVYEIVPPWFTWGSVILGPNKPPKAALETMLLSMQFGFEALGCSMAKLDVRRSNSRAIALYRRFGMRQVGEDELDYYFEISRDEFETVRPVHATTLAETED